MVVSVIIPAYNSSKTILDAITSVYNQTYDAYLDVIIVNDGSTDDTVCKVESFKCTKDNFNLRIINKPNGGVASARNLGMKNAKGDWIAFLDSDDIWLPNKLQRQFDCISIRPEISFIGTNRVGERTFIFWKEKVGLSPISLKDQFVKWHPHTSSILFKKELLNKVGFMNENLRCAEDNDFLIRILPNCNPWFLSEPLIDMGHGKRTFGEGGLSADLKKMQKGQRFVIREAFDMKLLNRFEYLAARCYSELKYLRRIVISKAGL